MSIFDRLIRPNMVGGVRAVENSNSTIGILVGVENEDLACTGYTSLANNPEIFTAYRRIAQLISSMPIMLMQNADNGDVRIFNELSRKIDIEPNSNMTRRTFIEAVVMNLLYGRGNSVATVKTSRGLIRDLYPVPPSMVSFVPEGDSYAVIINGRKYNHNDVLHFVDNPDQNYPWKGKGLTVVLSDIANNLKQAEVTKKGFMTSKWKPSLIVKVDALTEEFSSMTGRQKLLDTYVNSSQAGEPWLIPAEQFSVEQVRPLSLADLSINETVTLDKRTVAAIMGVPPFILGVGEYSQAAWNSFIQNTVHPIAQEIEQELTKKLIINPQWYLKFNILSLMDWDIKTVADVFGGLSDKGYITGNEVRDRIGLSPLDGLDELRVLENYIPVEKVGLQKKLIQEGE